MPSKTVPQKYKKKGNPNGLPFLFRIGLLRRTAVRLNINRLSFTA